MARYKSGVAGAAPLLMQLTAPVGSPCRVVEITASSEGTTGSVSRPVVSFPSTIGVGTTSAFVEKLHPSDTAPSATISTAFSTYPSFPTIPAYAVSAPLPYRAHWRGEIWATGSLLLYATATATYWTAELVWEEL